MSKHLVDIEHERLSFFTPAGEVKALDDVSFYVNEGEVLGVVGPFKGSKPREIFFADTMSLQEFLDEKGI